MRTRKKSIWLSQLRKSVSGGTTNKEYSYERKQEEYPKEIVKNQRRMPELVIW